MKNRIINGDMRIDQRNEGAALLVNTVAIALSRCPDKFITSVPAAAGTFTVQRLSATPPSGFTNYADVLVTAVDAAPAAGSNYSYAQRVEGFLLQDTAFGTTSAKNITLSFRVRCSITGTFYVAITNGGGTRSYVAPYVISAAATWTTVNITIPGETTGTWTFSNLNGMFVRWDLGAGSNFQATAINSWVNTNVYTFAGATRLNGNAAATLDITGVQLEVNNSATAFDYLLYGIELELCQRYYTKSFIQGTAPAQNVAINTGETQVAAAVAGVAADLFTTTYPATMRSGVAPVFYNPAAANANIRDETAGADGGAVTLRYNTDRGFALTANGAAGTLAGNVLGIHWSVDADL